MSIDIIVPSFGESISSATVARLLKVNGESVAKDEEIIELETDKATAAICAPESGQLHFSVKEGDEVAIGDVIGHVDPSKQANPETPLPEQKLNKEQKDDQNPVKPEFPAEKEQNGFRVFKEEELTHESSMSELNAPASLKPAAQQPQPASEDRVDHSSSVQNRKKMSGLRKTIAKRLVEVKNQTAMLTTFNEVDMTEVIRIRQSEKDRFLEKHGVKLGMTSFFVKAAAHAKADFPDVFAFIEEDEIVYSEGCDISVAVATEKGLFVPVIRNCHELSFHGIEKAIVEYAKKAKSGTISMKDMQGGCFTITNGGIFGSLFSTPILNPPQSAILGMHTIQKRPVVVDDTIEVRPMMYLALSYDHRIIDGKDAVKALAHIKASIESPSKLFLET